MWNLSPLPLKRFIREIASIHHKLLPEGYLRFRNANTFVRNYRAVDTNISVTASMKLFLHVNHGHETFTEVPFQCGGARKSAIRPAPQD